MMNLYFSKKCNRIAMFFLSLQTKALLSHGKEHVFFENIMDPSWNYKPYMHCLNPYFAQYGFKYNMVEFEYYKLLTGVESNLYIPHTFFYYYLFPYLNCSARYHQDKNMFRRLLDYDNRKMDYIMPHQIVYNMCGSFYTSENEICSKDEAVELILANKGDIIVKPTTHTSKGKNIVKLRREDISESQVNKLIDSYKTDFSFEECMIQHPALATFNESSLNTMRIVTYRKPSGEIKYLHGLLRFGGDGSVVDNASAGGGMVAIMENGDILRKIVHLRSVQTSRLDNNVTNTIPHFESVKQTALYLHTKLPYLNLIGWDMSVTPDGIPILIELNTRPSPYGWQTLVGPLFSQEDLDEIMPEIAKWKLVYDCSPIITFPGKKGYRGRISS